jgi:hypothetical protein
MRDVVESLFARFRAARSYEERELLRRTIEGLLSELKDPSLHEKWRVSQSAVGHPSTAARAGRSGIENGGSDQNHLLWSTTERELPASAIDGGKRLLVIIHGIRTEAVWAEGVCQLFEEIDGVTAVPLRYGYFPLHRFLYPKVFASAPLSLVQSELTSLVKNYPGYEISVLAHSFGTYLISEILRNYDMEIQHLILVGSIVRQDFPWGQIRHKVRGEIVNECGVRDIWPAFAGMMSARYGPSGVFGFSGVQVTSRFFNLAHSEFLRRAFCKQYWCPIVVSSSVQDDHQLDIVDRKRSAMLSIVSRFGRGNLLLPTSIAALLAVFFWY